MLLKQTQNNTHLTQDMCLSTNTCQTYQSQCSKGAWDQEGRGKKGK